MNEIDSILSKAFTIYEEWGPDRSIDRKVRLKSIFNSLSSNEIDSLITALESINVTIWKIAEMGAEIKLGKSKVIDLLLENHPQLISEGLSHAIFLANYYSFHEGYDQ